MTTPGLTPTPPADTRQQAAEPDLRARIQQLCDAAPLCDTMSLALTVAGGQKVVPVRDLATVLASSSPALPEPPAPTGRASLGPSDVVMEQLARAFYADYRKQHPGTLTWDTEPEWKRGEMWHLAYVAFSSLAAADVAEEGTR